MACSPVESVLTRNTLHSGRNSKVGCRISAGCTDVSGLALAPCAQTWLEQNPPRAFEHLDAIQISKILHHRRGWALERHIAQ